MRGVLAISFVVTLVLTPLVILLLRRFNVFDVPTERSSHVKRTPRGGGAAVAAGAVSAVVLAGTVGVVESWSIKTLLVCTSVFAVVGLIDDVRTLNVVPRLACQLGCAVLFVAPWFYVNVPVQGVGVKAALAFAAVVWVAGFLNAFNFMDGINGISGMHAVLAGALFVIIGRVEQHRIIELCGMAVAGAALAFLPFNFPKAKVFLGDVGSYFLGTWLAITALIALVWATPAEAVLGAFVIYVADTSYTLIDRIRRGEDWRRSHHDHVYQRLIELRWSHVKVTLTVFGFSLVCTALGLVSLTGDVWSRVIADATIPFVVVGYLLLPRLAIRGEALLQGRRDATAPMAIEIDGAPVPVESGGPAFSARLRPRSKRPA